MNRKEIQDIAFAALFFAVFVLALWLAGRV